MKKGNIKQMSLYKDAHDMLIQGNVQKYHTCIQSSQCFVCYNTDHYGTQRIKILWPEASCYDSPHQLLTLSQHRAIFIITVLSWGMHDIMKSLGLGSHKCGLNQIRGLNLIHGLKLICGLNLIYE